jgi:hypothetical protein
VVELRGAVARRCSWVASGGVDREPSRGVTECAGGIGLGGGVLCSGHGGRALERMAGGGAPSRCSGDAPAIATAGECEGSRGC